MRRIENEVKGRKCELQGRRLSMHLHHPHRIKGVLLMALILVVLSAPLGVAQIEQESAEVTSIVSTQQEGQLEQAVENPKVLRMIQTGQAAYTGEFYRVGGKKIGLLRSLEKIAVHYVPDQGGAISKRLRTKQSTGRLFAVEQELSERNVLIMRTSDISSVQELDDVVSQIQQDSDVVRATPVYINEEAGLEMIPTDEFIAKLAPEVTLEQLRAFNEQMGTTLIRRLRGTTDQFILSMALFSPEGLLAMCEVYLHEPIIVWASPNFLSEVVFDSHGDDRYLPSQWHLEKIDAAGAWDITTGRKDIVVAVIDGGVDIDHHDLRDSFPDDRSDRSNNGYSNDYYGWNFYDDNNNPRPSGPKDNHGTWVAGVIAAQGNNDEGVLGCAHNCTLMALRVSNGDHWTSGVKIAEAVLYAAGFHENGIGRWHGADVINISQSWIPTWEINEAIRKAATEGRDGKGCPIFCSSGNDPSGWIKASLPIFPEGSYSFKIRWEYRKDSSGSDGQDAMWMDQVIFPDGTEEDFERSVLPPTWRSGSDSPWTSVQNDIDGNHALTGWNGQTSRAVRSGPIGNNGCSYLEVTKTVHLSTQGTLTFWVWPSSQSGDRLRVLINDEPLTYESGEEFAITGISEKQDYLPFIAYPAVHPDTIAVGASTNFDYRADYSRYGLGLDFVAPSNGGSESIYTTDRTDTNTQVNGAEGDYYTEFGGTSASSPLAASVGALMLSSNPDLSAEQIRDIIQDTCEQIGAEPYRESYDNDPNTNRYYGHGRINALAALERTSSSNPTISGRVRTSDGSGLDGVSVSANNGGGSDITGSDGYYHLTIPQGWSGRATPSKETYTFEPHHKSYQAVTCNATDQDYLATYELTLSHSYIGGNDSSVRRTGGPWIIGTYTQEGLGLQGTSDRCHFASTYLSGNGSIEARVSIDGPGYSYFGSLAFCEAGVMIRETLNGDSKHAAAVIALPSEGGGPAMALWWRRQRGDDSEGYGGFATSHFWVRVVRDGDWFRAYSSNYGQTWDPIGDEVYIPMTQGVHLGLVVTASTENYTEDYERASQEWECTFENVKVVELP